MLKKSKKLLCIILSALMLLMMSSCTINELLDISQGAGGQSSQSGGASNEGSENNTQQETGRLLPQKFSVFADGEQKEVVFNWSENTCSFEIADYSITFVYDPSDRTVDLSCSKGFFDGKDKIVDFCTYDEKGRVVKMSIGDEDPIFDVSYEADGILVNSMLNVQDFSPTKISVNTENNTIPFPPFKTEEDVISLSEHGDITEFFGYEYDEHGNITKIRLLESSDDNMAITPTYGDAPMTESWQKIPLKWATAFFLGYSVASICYDVFCNGLFWQP